MADFTTDYYGFLIERLAPLVVRSQLRGETVPIRTLESPLDRKLDTLRTALSTDFPADGLVMEFGVHKARSIRLIAGTLPDRTVYGFDSFTGFPDDGRTDWPNDLSLKGNLPGVLSNVELVAGYFEDTLPGFFDSHSEDVGLMHVDCDLYSSTRTIFSAAADRIRPGTIIVFDELLHLRGFENNEMLAFYEFLLDRGLNFEWLAGFGRVMDFTSYIVGYDQTPRKGKHWLVAGFEQEFAVRITADGPPLRSTRPAVRQIAEALANAHPLSQPLREPAG